MQNFAVFFFHEMCANGNSSGESYENEARTAKQKQEKTRFLLNYKICTRNAVIIIFACFK